MGKSETASTRTGGTHASGSGAATKKKVTQFTTEFETRIVEPIVERRTALAASAQLSAGDEVAPRMTEVAEETRLFLARVAQKLDSAIATPLLLTCADRLAALREHSFARDKFYAGVLALCDELKEAALAGGGNAMAPGGGGAAALGGDADDEDESEFSAPVVQVLAWRTRAVYGSALCGIEEVKARDHWVKYPHTAKALLVELRQIERAMAVLLSELGARHLEEVRTTL